MPKAAVMMLAVVQATLAGDSEPLYPRLRARGLLPSGILGERQDEILDLLVRQQKAVLIDPVERQTEMQD